jgi:voltage-gated potassium channel Kch
LRQDNFVYLFVALILFLVVIPIAEDTGLVPIQWARNIAFICIMAIGVWSLHKSRRSFYFGLILAGSGILINIIAVTTGADWMYFLSMASLAAFLLFAIGGAFRLVLFSESLDANRLFGAVCVYLMIGILFALAYSVLSKVEPTAFSGMSAAHSLSWNVDWVYYSFVTLTTLGYGDILPQSGTARALAYSEAVLGVFYMAMLVAALVGAYATRDRSQ